MSRNLCNRRRFLQTAAAAATAGPLIVPRHVLSQDGNPVPLVIGSGFFGLLLGFLAWKTDSIFWCIIAHVVGGLIIVI